MAPPQHKQTGIRLPKALRDELGIDDSRGPPLLKWKGRTSVQRGDRKDQRKLQRQEKKSRNYQQTKRGSVQSHNDGRKDESDVEDPFGISDASDIDFVKEPPAPKLNTQKNPNPESEPEPEPLKSILKPTLKRKATGEEPEPETKSELPKKKTLSKGVRDRLAQDEAEIEYLEKKLKIKNKKIPTSFEEDGLDFLLGDLKDDYLDSRLQKVVWINRTENLTFNDEGDENDTDHLDRDIFYGSEPDEKGVHENDEFHGFSDTEISDRSLEEPTEESQEPLQALPKIRENPYKPPSAEKSVGKYIPPSLRKPADTESEQLVRLRRQIQGRINRLSEANLISILGDVETVYRTHPRGDVTHILTDILLNTLCDPSVLMDTYHILHGGFLAGLYKIMGVDVGANVVQRIVEEFMKHHDRVNGIVEPSTSGKECTNLISFLSELYNFQVVSCVLIFDLIRMFLDELTELHTELLLKVVRNSGHQLRIDDPTALKSLVALLQPAIAKAGGQDKLSIRTKFMIETLTNLKNNRLKSSAASSTVITESTIRMKKLLGGLSNRNLRATEPLRASLDDIRNTETKGKWWLVGASWVGGTNTTPTSQDGPTENTQISDSEDDETSIPDLHALARQHRMNTDIRRAIFVTLLSSSDYAEAHTRLLKLRLKRSQEREIPRVLLHCAVGEQSYNPYYTLVARKFCCAHPMRMAFTFALWGYFRRFGEDDGSNAAAEFDDDDDVEKDAWSRTEGLRKIVNLARLYGSLVSDGSLGLSILKTLSWGYLQSPTKTFLEVFFATVFVGVTTAIDTNTSIFTSTTHSKDGVERVFSKTAENLDLVRGVLYFLKKNKALKMAETAVGKKDKETVKRGVTAARGLLGGFLNELVVVDG